MIFVATEISSDLNYDKGDVKIKREQVRYALDSMGREGTIGKRKLLGKNTFFLKDRERQVGSFLCLLKDRWRKRAIQEFI